MEARNGGGIHIRAHGGHDNKEEAKEECGRVRAQSSVRSRETFGAQITLISTQRITTEDREHPNGDEGERQQHTQGRDEKETSKSEMGKKAQTRGNKS